MALSMLYYFAFLISWSTASPLNLSFPHIDLGYATHAPTFINSTQAGLRIANYNNIRFAQPPVGDLRFRAPQTPPPLSDGVVRGDEFVSTDCVNSVPSVAPLPPFNGTTWGQEDCLFLNVLVPEGVREGDNVPVIHWIHGSAYAFGSKDNYLLTGGFPLALFNALDAKDEKFIFVASNYRLGLYGWMASLHEDMDANIGIHDAEVALRWTRQHISKFGGDPSRITAMGQSGGAGILNYLLVKSGDDGLPFSQAIISSPGLMPRRNVTARRQEVYENVLAATNCTSLHCLRFASPDTLQRANQYLLNVPSGTGGGAFGPGIGFAPLPDGVHYLDSPSVLLADNTSHRGLNQLLVGNMAQDGLGLVPDENMPAAFGDLVRAVFPRADNETVRRIQKLFPFPSSNPKQLAWDWGTSVIFACNSQSIAAAYPESARRYVMAIPPAAHGLDLPYIFFMNNSTTPVSSPPVAREIQKYVLHFIAGHKANASTGFPVYGSQSNIALITGSGPGVEKDPWVNKGICKELLAVAENPANGA
ncbi:carboxyl ester lipase [Aspergillus ambiguus]|uniref:carboxyl ester lipase n=1 Tax=Aspergillus ambiguus TaxID=176160 RepID=UPI003CCD248E